MRKRLSPLLCFTLWFILCFTSSASLAQTITPEMKIFIQQMSTEHGFNAKDLEKTLKKTAFRQDAIDAMQRPAESLPWHKYRAIFITEKRINNGVQFWKKNQATLARAERKYGVPASIIVAILGVETSYGEIQGEYPVLDTLTTLAFHYPKRATFFRKELEQYLLLTREEKMNPLTVKGSYAGAMGWGQFISSSYRHYAVDFSGNGQRDLFNNVPDVIGSVANYFQKNGWKSGQPVAMKARVTGTAYESRATRKADKPVTTLSSWKSLGVNSAVALNPSLTASLVALDNHKGTEYWLGLQNFYVITRYNQSPLYAMAVYQLSQAIQKKMAQSQDTVTDAHSDKSS